MPLGVARATTARALGAQAEWLPTNLPSLVGWYSSTRSTFSLTGAAINQWNNAGPATPDLVTGVSPTLDDEPIDFVVFDGVNDFLTFATTLSALIGASVYSILCAVKIRSNAEGASPSTWNVPAIIADDNQFFGIHIRNNASPFSAYLFTWDGAEKKTANQSVTANTLTVLQAWHTGSVISIQKNEDTPAANVAAGAATTTTGDVRVGICGSTDKAAAIDLYDLVVTNAEISAPDRALYYAFIQAEYVGAPPAFTPADLPSIVHWWHAVDSPKTGSPGDISQIDDLVGSYDLTQAVGAAQPDDNTRTVNGKVSLDFDGGDQLGSVSAPSVSNNGTVYGFVIAQADALVDSDMFINTGAVTAGDDGFNLRLDESSGETGRLQLNWANGTTLEAHRPSTPVIGTSAPHLIEFWIIGTTGGVNIAVDGTDATGGTNTVGYGSPDSIGIMARAGATTNAMDGAGCEWGLCTAVPDAGNRASLLAYAQSYWGVA